MRERKILFKKNLGSDYSDPKNKKAGDVLLSHVRCRCAAIGGLWRPQPTPTDPNRLYLTLCDSNRPYNFLLIPKLQLPLQPFLSRGTFAAPFIFSHLPAFHLTDFATHPARPRTDSPAFYRTNFARAPARQSDGLTFGIPSPAFPRTDFARIRKADANSTISQSRYGRNQPPPNHEPTILRVEYKNDSDSTIPHL